MIFNDLLRSLLAAYACGASGTCTDEMLGV
jgi:hypothetical protein